MTKRVIGGIYAAVLIPRDAQGELHETSMAHQLEFLLAHGIRNFAFNGATGEYCWNSLADLKRCLKIAKAVLPPDAGFICGVGAGRLLDTLALGRAGLEAGAKGLLVPTPYFFPYEQDDISAFIHAVASELPIPILLYNLPQFTSPFEDATVTTIISRYENVVGIKDSSGSLQILRALTHQGIDCSRLLGNDSVLPQALTEGVCDGVVSGVACVLPEIIQSIFSKQPGSAAFKAVTEKLREFITRLEILPVPWGLKAIAEARGISMTKYQLPLSARRMNQISEFQSWFSDWFSEVTASETDHMPLIGAE